MDELTVRRWRRYGKDRLYVNLADGEHVGWVDLQTGAVQLDREDLWAEFEEAVRRHGHDVEEQAALSPATSVRQQSDLRAGQSFSDAEQPPEPRGVPGAAEEPYAITIDWRDLGTHEPGKAAQEQADARRRAAPVRTVAARLLGVHTDERAWRVGAAGERRVAARLERLADDWKVVHAVPVGNRGADIDHLVVGPGGVFTINAKHHPDASVWVAGNTFLVNGQRQPYVRNARHEAKRAGRLLSAAVGFPVEAAGVIAVVGAHKGITIKAQPDDVHVVGRKRLPRLLTSFPPRFTSQQVDELHRAARRSDTWR